MKQSQELKAVYDRHVDVDHQQVDFPVAQQRQRVGRGRRGEHIPRPFREGLHQLLDHIQKAGVVIDEQDCCAFGWHDGPRPTSETLP